MRLGITIDFKDMPADVLQTINSLGSFSANHKSLGEWLLIKRENSFEFVTERIDASLPQILHDLPANVTVTNHLYGYIMNGIFRYGTARGQVETWTQTDDTYGSFANTNSGIHSEGPSQKAYNDAITLFRLIRARKLKKGHIIEEWPVGLTQNMIDSSKIYEDEETEA